LRRLAANLERLRIDRQLDEALTNGADPLHLAAGFGGCGATAIRYRSTHAIGHVDPPGAELTRVRRLLRRRVLVVGASRLLVAPGIHGAGPTPGLAG
jgi:hypothetical protein